MENRRDQGAGVTDTDPEDKIGDTPGPGDRNVVSPDADSGEQKIENAEEPESGNRAGNRDRDPPPARRLVLHDSGNSIRNPCHRVVVPHERTPWHPFHENRRRCVALSHYALPPLLLASA